ncbi:MAG: YccF domain-containing protein [Solirubrobacterales bacterium]|nr:YccF domain-containing protein [Solirubrobacterales bacterium]
MRLIGNIIWLVLTGFATALGWLLASLLMCITIIGIPFGVQGIKIAMFTLWPFGRTLVKRPTAGAPSAIGNVVWLILAGWWLAIMHLVAAVVMALTIIGIPLAAGHLKLIPVSLWPFGREIVSVEEARAIEATSAVAVR